MKKQELKKYKESLRRLGHLQKGQHPMPEEEEQETENLFKEIMKENFLNLAKKINIQIQEAQRDSNKLDPKRST